MFANPSEPPFLWKRLTLQLSTFESKRAPDPEGDTVMVVSDSTYPFPGSIILTEETSPPDKIGVKIAPTPTPLTVIFGKALYPLPFASITTSTNLPWLIIGFNCAPLPLERLMTGCLLKLRTSEDPYPIPLEVNCTEVIPPLNIGSAWALYVSSDTPNLPSIETTMSW